MFCIYCKEEFESKRIDSKVCVKIDCRKKYKHDKVREWYISNKEKYQIDKRRYYHLNKEKHKMWVNRSFKKHRKTRQAQKTIYRRNHYQNDVNFNIACRLRTRLFNKINKNINDYRTLDLVGCSIEQLKQYLENKFKIGMSWDNKNLWEIDHIIPCSKFNLLNSDEIKRCFHYTNLQPLWKHINRIKSNKIIVEEIN